MNSYIKCSKLASSLILIYNLKEYSIPNFSAAICIVKSNMKRKAAVTVKKAFALLKGKKKKKKN